MKSRTRSIKKKKSKRSGSTKATRPRNTSTRNKSRTSRTKNTKTIAKTDLTRDLKVQVAPTSVVQNFELEALAKWIDARQLVQAYRWLKEEWITTRGRDTDSNDPVHRALRDVWVFLTDDLRLSPETTDARNPCDPLGFLKTSTVKCPPGHLEFTLERTPVTTCCLMQSNDIYRQEAYLFFQQHRDLFNAKEKAYFFRRYIDVPTQLHTDVSERAFLQNLEQLKYQTLEGELVRILQQQPKIWTWFGIQRKKVWMAMQKQYRDEGSLIQRFLHFDAGYVYVLLTLKQFITLGICMYYMGVFTFLPTAMLGPWMPVVATGITLYATYKWLVPGIAKVISWGILQVMKLLAFLLKQMSCSPELVAFALRILFKILQYHSLFVMTVDLFHVISNPITSCVTQGTIQAYRAWQHYFGRPLGFTWSEVATHIPGPLQADAEKAYNNMLNAMKTFDALSSQPQVPNVSHFGDLMQTFQTFRTQFQTENSSPLQTMVSGAEAYVRTAWRTPLPVAWSDVKTLLRPEQQAEAEVIFHQMHGYMQDVQTVLDTSWKSGVARTYRQFQKYFHPDRIERTKATEALVTSVNEWYDRASSVFRNPPNT